MSDIDAMMKQEREILDAMPVEELDLGVRAYNALRMLRIEKCGQLLNLINISDKTLAELETAVKAKRREIWRQSRETA